MAETCKHCKNALTLVAGLCEICGKSPDMAIETGDPKRFCWNCKQVLDPPFKACLVCGESQAQAADYAYKAIPFRGKVTLGDSVQLVSDQLQTAINDHTKGGWEFVQLGQVTIRVQCPGHGCILFFLSLIVPSLGEVRFETYDQIIFRRRKSLS